MDGGSAGSTSEAMPSLRRGPEEARADRSARGAADKKTRICRRRRQILSLPHKRAGDRQRLGYGWLQPRPRLRPRLVPNAARAGYPWSDGAHAACGAACRPSGEAPISRRGSWPHVAARCCIAGGFASLMLSPSPALSRPFSPREFPFCVSRLQICAARSSVTDRCQAAPSKAPSDCTCARCKVLAAYAMFRSWFFWRFMS